MFLHLSVILFTGGVSASGSGGCPPLGLGVFASRFWGCLPLGPGVDTPWDRHPLDTHTHPWADTPCTHKKKKETANILNRKLTIIPIFSILYVSKNPK